MSAVQRGSAKWVWLPGFLDRDDELPGKFVLFRKSIELEQIPQTPSFIHVSADTRYKLYVNGSNVAFGPCKSYPTRWYYETVDISPFLKTGTNVLAAKVLRFFPDQMGCTSLMRTNIPGFILWGQVHDLPIYTDESWLCREDRSVRLQPRSEWNYILGPPFLSLDERANCSTAQHWQDPGADASDWSQAIAAVHVTKMMPALEPWKLFERPIPMLPELDTTFARALRTNDHLSLQEWNSLLCKGESVQLAKGQEVFVEFEASYLTTGFLEFDFEGGDGTEMTMLYAESYEKDLGTDHAPFPLPRSKSNRRDWETGRLYGTQDHIVLSAGDSGRTHYEPFWWRTFRFIRMTIRTKSSALTVRRITFRETRYPIEFTTKLSLPSGHQQIWDICLRTLQNCMHETYEDCPFYEQNQFAMDCRLQLLFTYQLSRDDRLARKTIHEFHASRREDGLLETNFPVSFRAINIPQFSLFWIVILYDHMMYFGDAALVRRYINTADGILNYFDSTLNEDGLVGAFDSECWAFVDWVKEWHGSKGIRHMAVPPTYHQTGVVTYNSLVYAWTLQHGAELCDFIGRKDTAAEYRQRADNLSRAVNKHCFNGEYYLDGPKATEISEHAQVFAVLSGAITAEAARDLILRTRAHPSMPRCSYALRHYVFRALEKTGLYGQCFAEMMKPWKEMVHNNMTTCAEDEVNFRSDCHGWSASPIYEFVAGIYGLRPTEPGFQKFEAVPRKEVMEEGSLEYSLPSEVLRIRWTAEQGETEVSTSPAKSKPEGLDEPKA